MLVHLLAYLHQNSLFYLMLLCLLLKTTSASGLPHRTDLLTEMQDWRTVSIMRQSANCQPALSAACP